MLQQTIVSREVIEHIRGSRWRQIIPFTNPDGSPKNLNGAEVHGRYTWNGGFIDLGEANGRLLIDPFFLRSDGLVQLDILETDTLGPPLGDHTLRSLWLITSRGRRQPLRIQPVRILEQ